MNTWFKVAVGLVGLLLQFGLVPAAHAWKPGKLCTNWPFQLCGEFVQKSFSANPTTVVLPSYSVAGRTTITWKWDFEPRSPWFNLACIYVQMNDSSVATIVQCEYPGNTNYTNADWITAGNVYTFFLAQGDPSIPSRPVSQLITPANSTPITVVGVVQ